jgi:hypothetical protein
MRGSEKTTQEGTPRRLTLLDALILIVPLAVGLSLTRSYVGSDPVRVHRLGAPPPWLRTYLSAEFLRSVGSRFASMAMLGLLVIRLRRPRPDLRRLSRQPGAVACAAAVTAMAADGAVVLAWAIFRTVPIPVAVDFWRMFAWRIGPAVVGAWTALALGGRWRAEKSWIDRAGRFLGAFWVFEEVHPWFSLGFYHLLPSRIWWLP